MHLPYAQAVCSRLCTCVLQVNEQEKEESVIRPSSYVRHSESYATRRPKLELYVAAQLTTSFVFFCWHYSPLMRNSTQTFTQRLQRLQNHSRQVIAGPFWASFRPLRRWLGIVLSAAGAQTKRGLGLCHWLRIQEYDWGGSALRRLGSGVLAGELNWPAASSRRRREPRCLREGRAESRDASQNSSHCSPG